MERQQSIDIISAFIIEKLGFGIRETQLHEETFLPGVKIEGTTLLVDPEKLKYPGDLLHEAGHLALTPATERPLLQGNVIDNNPNKAGEEIAVMLWTYLAALEIDIDPAVVFHNGGYKGSSTWLIDTFQNHTYIGLPLLEWMGMAEQDGENTLPRVIRWLRD